MGQTMSEPTLKDIIIEIQYLDKRLDKLEWLIIDSKLESVEPTSEEVEIIKEYLKEKKKGLISFEKFV